MQCYNFHIDIKIIYDIIYIVPTKKRGETMGIHKGTKLSDSPKINTLKFRYDDTTKRQLEYLSKKEDVSKAEIIRRGIEIQYNNKKE